MQKLREHEKSCVERKVRAGELRMDETVILLIGTTILNETNL